mgnify:FL=1
MYNLEVYDQLSSNWIVLYNAFEVLPVMLNWINPDNGEQNETLSVTISGENIDYGYQWSGTLSDFRFSQAGSNIFYGTPTSTWGNELEGEVSISVTQNIGVYDLEVFDQASASWIVLSNAFVVNPPEHSITPNTSAQNQSLQVFISGNNQYEFQQWSCLGGPGATRINNNGYNMNNLKNLIMI